MNICSFSVNLQRGYLEDNSGHQNNISRPGFGWLEKWSGYVLRCRVIPLLAKSPLLQESIGFGGEDGAKKSRIDFIRRERIPKWDTGS